MIIRGDARRLPLADETVDAIVTDPPYGLEFMGKTWDRLGGGRMSKTGIGDRSIEWPNQRGWNERRCRTCGHLSHGGSPCICAKPSFVAADNRWTQMQVWHEEWAREALRVAKPGAHLVAFGGTRTFHRLTVAIEDAGWEIRDCLCWLYGQGFPKSLNVGGGIGTALKPAWEPIILARKPLIGTVAANLGRFGTGGVNIEACRLPVNAEADASQIRTMNRGQRVEDTSGQVWGLSKNGGDIPQVVHPEGRWPANVCLDEETAGMVDEQSGACGSTSGYIGQPTTDAGGRSWRKGAHAQFHYTGSGGASRFFYVAKASRAEREKGCETLPPRTGAQATERQPDTAGLNSPRAGAGRTATTVRCFHPTVKPITLMRWLIRLVTPPGGLVLDPFVGSGSTCCAAALEGRRSLGVDLDADYVRIAMAREAYWMALPPEPPTPPSSSSASPATRPSGG